MEVTSCLWVALELIGIIALYISSVILEIVRELVVHKDAVVELFWHSELNGTSALTANAGRGIMHELPLRGNNRSAIATGHMI